MLVFQHREPFASMPAQILDGKMAAAAIRQEIAEETAQHTSAGGMAPGLVAVLVGEDPASQVYVRNKETAAKAAGFTGDVIRLPAETTQSQLLHRIERLNQDNTVHGILVQLPLPSHIAARAVLDAVDPLKDVDCFSPVNVGLLSQGRPRFLPCTPAGVQQLLGRYQIDVAGRHVVVVGRSDIVGRPLSIMLSHSSGPFGPSNANATVTLCHSQTQNLRDICQTADILVAAIGRARFITADMVRPGAVVIDVGINRDEHGLCGDVDYENVCSKAAAITPVPGGIGPLTIAMLLRNTLLAAKMSNSRSADATQT